MFRKLIEMLKGLLGKHITFLPITSNKEEVTTTSQKAGGSITHIEGSTIINHTNQNLTCEQVTIIIVNPTNSRG